MTREEVDEKMEQLAREYHETHDSGLRPGSLVSRSLIRFYLIVDYQGSGPTNQSHISLFCNHSSSPA
jgi:hypothetical protein